jgi:hypothetical protein
LWVCFTPLPRSGSLFRDSRRQPLHLFGGPCPLVVGSPVTAST